MERWAGRVRRASGGGCGGGRRVAPRRAWGVRRDRAGARRPPEPWAVLCTPALVAVVLRNLLHVTGPPVRWVALLSRHHPVAHVPVTIKRYRSLVGTACPISSSMLQVNTVYNFAKASYRLLPINLLFVKLSHHLLGFPVPSA